MTSRYMNITLHGRNFEVNVSDAANITDVRVAIKSACHPDLAHVGAPRIHIYDERYKYISSFAAITSNQLYFTTLEDGGVSLLVRIDELKSDEIRSTKYELIPPRSWYPIESAMFYPLTVRLRAFINSRVIDGWIMPENGMQFPGPSSSPSKLYIQEWYEEVYEGMLSKFKSNKVKSFAILGKPSEERSLFFMYLLYRLTRDSSHESFTPRPKRILYQRPPERYVLYDLVRKTYEPGMSSGEADILLRDPETFYYNFEGTWYIPGKGPAIFEAEPESLPCSHFITQEKAATWNIPLATGSENRVPNRKLRGKKLRE
jgi:hypothetical protein